VKNVSCRRIQVYPLACAGLCRDECIAVSLIAAAQHGQCPALRACAYALTESNDIDAMLGDADQFARVLKDARQILTPGRICNVTGIPIEPGRARVH
jgi:hypothetical protein